LKWVENVLPDIKSSVGVSESKDHELGVNSDDTLDILGLFFNDVRMDGFVGCVTYFTLPIVKVTVIGSTDNK
jgi:hypothetical protein